MTKKIAHLTSVHPRYDTRIFLKECRSLEKAGYSVSLVVADGKGDEIKDNVNIVDVGKPDGRLDRMFHVTKRVLERAKLLDADIYHFHDPELIPIGIKLKKLSKKVIFDSHEDYPKQMVHKPYLDKVSLWLIARGVAQYEKWACKRFDAVIAATAFIRDKFLAINSNSVDINNFPMLGELTASTNDWSEKRNEVCYVGAMGVVRGIKEIVQEVEKVKSGARLQLGGEFTLKRFEDEVMALPGWKNVDGLGWLDREGVRNVLDRSMAGLVILHPVVHYLDALPVKMFEYMSAGLPVIASNFPLWREIIEGNDCGLCVDPMDTSEIAEAIDYLINNPVRAQQMGENGKKAVHDFYNWATEEQKLFKLYQDLI